MHAVQVQRIKQCKYIFPELLDRVGARCERGSPVPPSVVAQDAEVLSKFGHLRIPHGIIGAKRIREHQHRSSTLTFQRVMNSGFSTLNDGRASYSPPGGILP